MDQKFTTKYEELDAKVRKLMKLKQSPVKIEVIRINENDYINTPGIGSHKFFTDAKNWNDAKKACEQDGAHLAIVNSKQEENVSFFQFIRTKKKSQVSLVVLAIATFKLNACIFSAIY